MSIVLPHSAAEAEAWTRRGPEPIELQMPGWTREDHAPGAPGVLANQRITIFKQGDRLIVMTRNWDRILNPGMPMQVKSTRTARTTRRVFEVTRTSMFQGVVNEVETFWVPAGKKDWSAQLVFHHCPPEIVDDACSRLVVLDEQ